MKLENQIVSLELAKRLKELGCKQDSIFKWHSKLDEKGNRVYTEIVYLPIKQMEQDYSAFTSSELGEMLPLDVEGVKLHIHREKGLDSWDVSYNTDAGNTLDEIWEQAESEANARAKMLIWLIENKMMEVWSEY